VKVAIPDFGVAVGSNPRLDEPSPEAPVETRLASSQPWQPSPGSTLDRRTATRAALKAGVLGVFIGIIPFLGIVLTGALAVFFYRRENRFVLPAALGSRLGGAAGVVAFAINALMIAIRIFVFHAQQKYFDDTIAIIQRFGVNTSDPELQASIHNLFTPSGLAITFFFGMIVSVILASVGGALASLFLRSRDTRA
jgi:hypothetical protein